MIVKNINTEDKLINGHIKFINNKATDIYVELDDDNASIKSIKSDQFLPPKNWVRIQRTEVNFNTNKIFSN